MSADVTLDTRANLEARIAAAKAKYDRLPHHWEARRIAQMSVVMSLVDEWIAVALDHDQA